MGKDTKKKKSKTGGLMKDLRDPDKGRWDKRVELSKEQIVLLPVLYKEVMKLLHNVPKTRRIVRTFIPIVEEFLNVLKEYASLSTGVIVKQYKLEWERKQYSSSLTEIKKFSKQMAEDPLMVKTERMLDTLVSLYSSINKSHLDTYDVIQRFLVHFPIEMTTDEKEMLIYYRGLSKVNKKKIQYLAERMAKDHERLFEQHQPMKLRKRVIEEINERFANEYEGKVLSDE